MRFRFQIVSSEYHKGRLRFTYDPVGGNAVVPYNTVYTQILDIADEKDFTMDVGWARDKPFNGHIPLEFNEPYFGTTPIGTFSFFGNGVLSVYVLNPLTTPNSIAENDIQINVFISMLDDFEVAAPNDTISRVRFSPVPPVVPVPESEEMVDADSGQCTVVTDPPVAGTFADTIISDSQTTKLFFGEVIGSFRQLLKRDYHFERTPLDAEPNVYETLISRPSYPYYGGYTTQLGAVGSNVAQPLLLGDYAFGQTTLMNYMGRAFLGWRGSTRWTVDISHVGLFSGTAAYYSTLTGRMWRTLTSKILNRSEELAIANNVWENIAINATILRSSTYNGCSIWSADVNPVHTVEVPFYSNERFKTTFRPPDFVVEADEPGWSCAILCPGDAQPQNGSWLDLYVSAGEDFNLFFFNGLPIVYYEAVYPSA